MGVDRLAERRRVGDLPAVDAENHVALPEPGLLGRRPRANLVQHDPGAVLAVADRDAQVSVLHAAGAREPRGDRADGVGRDREADAGVLTGLALDLRVDAD